MLLLRPTLKLITHSKEIISGQGFNGTYYQTCGGTSFERTGELGHLGLICRQEARSQIRSTTRGVSLCPIIDEIVECLDPFSECYSPEEMARYKGITLKLTVELLEGIAEQSGASQFASVIGLLKSCPIYKQFVHN